jgi:RNA polymerase sigma-70 factor (ECF subfamily)
VTSGGPVGQPVEQVFREQYARAVAVLVRVFGDVDVAEEAVADAFTTAVQRWPEDGVPPSPAGWIITTARNRAIDRLRREASRADRHAQAALLHAQEEPADPGAVADDRLRLVFTCCHPALAPAAQVALTLRLLGGLTTAEIARAFLVPEPTMAKRLVRARQKIATARIPYRVPVDAELPERLPSVLAVVHLIATEGYAPSSGDGVVRVDLEVEAIRLARLVAELMPGEPEVLGLQALMRFNLARTDARFDDEGGIVLLRDQDRSKWDRRRIDETFGIVGRFLAMRRQGPYQLQALIAGAHADAKTWEATRWPEILQSYDALLTIADSPVVRLNRAIALWHVHGAEQAYIELFRLADDLDRYHLYHATRAELLRALGRSDEARAADRRALELTDNPAERALLAARLG